MPHISASLQSLTYSQEKNIDKPFAVIVSHNLNPEPAIKHKHLAVF